MNKTILALMILSVVFILGCQPVTEPAEPAEVSEPAAEEPMEDAAEEPMADAAPEEMAEEPMEDAELTPAPLENIPVEPSTGVDIETACYGLMSAEDFTSICGYEGTIKLTPKISEKGCWLNVASSSDRRLTAGFTTIDWMKSEKAVSEFDRGVLARVKQGAVEGQAVGSRSYEYDEIERHNVVWVRGSFLTRLGSTIGLCPADKLIDLANKIDEGLR